MPNFTGRSREDTSMDNFQFKSLREMQNMTILEVSKGPYCAKQLAKKSKRNHFQGKKKKKCVSFSFFSAIYVWVHFFFRLLSYFNQQAFKISPSPPPTTRIPQNSQQIPAQIHKKKTKTERIPAAETEILSLYSFLIF